MCGEVFQRQVELDIEDCYISKSLEPIQCKWCDSEEGFNWVATDVCSGVAWEQEVYCKSCGILNGEEIRGEYFSGGCY